jgi:hypothetical protein
MKSNLKAIIDELPDFDDLKELANEIGELSFKKMQLENRIKAMEAETFKKAMLIQNPDGKFPSASFVTNAYLHTGLNGELVEERLKLADVSATLDKRKILLSIYRDMLEVFRTVSANERNIAAY